jgi:glycerophosphoryl diester phosphodiesterase
VETVARKSCSGAGARPNEGKGNVKKRPLIIAHRGHSVALPEQTIAAFEAAVRLGAEMIEADVQLTRDGRLITMHDERLERTTSGTGLVSERDWAEIAELDAGSWFDPRFAAERVPLLDDLFALAEEAGIALCLEAKGETPQAFAGIALATAREIERRGRLDVDALASFDHVALALAADAVPGLRTAPDRLPEHGPTVVADVVAQAERCKAKIIQHHHADLTAEGVAAMQAAGLAVWAWPPTTRADVERSFALGVDGLMGDDVAVIADVVST